MNAYWDILTAARTTLRNLEIVAPYPAKIRKRPYFDPDHDGAPPALIVSPLGEQVQAYAFENVAIIDYPVVVVFFQGQGATLMSEDELELQLNVREAIRKALSVTNLTAATMDVNYDAAPAFDLEGLDNLYDVSIQLFTYRTKEERK
jgi:hypothetical protein